MNNYIQVIFELKNDTVYKPSTIVKNLSEIYPELGNEIILPIDMSRNDAQETPIFIFSQNPLFKVSGNFYNIIITVSDKFRQKLEEIIINIFAVFKNYATFSAAACTIQNELPAEKVQSMKSKFLKNYDSLDTDVIQLNFIREIMINGEKTRCLEGYATTNHSLITHFEFNMIRDNQRTLTIERFKKFFIEIKKYIDEKNI